LTEGTHQPTSRILQQQQWFIKYYLHGQRFMQNLRKFAHAKGSFTLAKFYAKPHVKLLTALTVALIAIATHVMQHC